MMQTLQTTRILKREWGQDLGNPIAVVKAEPDELVRDVGLAFAEGHDDLDDVRIVLLKATSGTEYALLRHANAPKPGTQVLARTTNHQPRRFAADLRELLRYLKLDRADVAWLAPTVKQHWRGVAGQRKQRAPISQGARTARRASKRSR